MIAVAPLAFWIAALAHAPEAVRTNCPVFTQFVVGQNLKVLRHVAPIYPPELANKVVGHVGLSVTVGMDGSVLHIEVVASTHPAFTKAALVAVRQWRFEVPDFGHGPTCVDQHLDFDFRHK